MRISKTQADVLRRMISGECMRQSAHRGGAWVYDSKGPHWIRRATVRALERRQLIKMLDAELFYPTRYRITETGHKALEEYDAKAN